MKLASRGAPALLVFVLSSLGCARAPAPRDARWLREPPLDSPARSMLGPRPLVWVAPSSDRPSFHTVVGPEVRVARRLHR